MATIPGVSHLVPILSNPVPKFSICGLIHGSYTGVALPVPIPNTEVKYAKADDTRLNLGK